MDSFLGPALTQVARPEVRVCAKLVNFYALLHLPSADLHHVLEKELDEDPAVELADVVRCPQCMSLYSGTICFRCHLELVRKGVSPHYSHEEAFEFQEPAPFTLHDALQQDLLMLAKPEEMKVGSAIIEMINDDGYFTGELEEAARRVKLPLEEAERVLKLVQQLSPVGVGARDPQECLLLQLRYLDGSGSGSQLALRVVGECWEEFKAMQFHKIARKLGVTEEKVKEAVQFVRRNLNPFPGRGFFSPWNANEKGSPVSPDVVIRKEEGGRYSVEVVDDYLPSLRISPAYLEMWEKVKQDPESFSPEERAHIEEYFQRARDFLDNLRQRVQTIEKVVQIIVTEQREFLEKGRRYLKPMTRARVAEILSVHPSTVGRAVAGKWALLPSGALFPLEGVFEGNTGVKEVIKELIESEDSHHPLTDQEIVEILSRRGMEIARRTVAKYREELSISPYTKRCFG